MVEACRGDTRLRLQVAQMVGQMLNDPATQPLAISLSRIIAGERDLVLLTGALDGEPEELVNRILSELDKAESEYRVLK